MHVLISIFSYIPCKFDMFNHILWNFDYNFWNFNAKTVNYKIIMVVVLILKFQPIFGKKT